MNEIMNISGIECYEQDGTAYLKLETVARGLGFTQEKNGAEYVRWETINGYLAELGFPNKLGKDVFIPENIFYRLAMKAKNEAAERFQAKIADEVIPSIRKHGAYVAPNAALSDTTKQALAEAKLNNSRARLSSVWLKLAQQVNLPEYRQICVSYASGVLAGKPVLPLPEGGQRHYTATEIGKMFGVSARKIGDLAKANGIKCEQFGKWYHDKSPYSAKEVDTFRYNDAAIGQFERLLRGVGKAG